MSIRRIILFLLLVAATVVAAQPVVTNNDLGLFINPVSPSEATTIRNADTTQLLPPIVSPKRRLLPENMSIVERGLWSESGLFRGIGLAAPLTPEVRRSELSLRRTMLTMHQVGGFATFGLMAASCYYGQRILDGHPFDSEKHSALVKYAIASYAVTGALSVLSPPPVIRRDEYSTTSLHKTLAWIHFSGMVLTPIIGHYVWRFQGPRNSPTLVQNNSAARFHQISAYLTTATLGAAMAVMTF